MSWARRLKRVLGIEIERAATEGIVSADLSYWVAKAGATTGGRGPPGISVHWIDHDLRMRP
jgi:hypothetical protein